MKKGLILVLSIMLLSILYGVYFIRTYKNTLEAIKEVDESVYIIQQGVYSSRENAIYYSSGLNSYVIEPDNNKFRVYVGITQNKEICDDIKGIYNNMGKDIYVWEKSISNNAFNEVLKQYDLLIIENKSTDILSIQKQVLNKYEELVLRENELFD